MNNKRSQHKTQQFLDAMEQSRKAKPCTATVDLRKRVPGECRDYTLAGIKHCLDDRGYVLLKDLINANGGQYTVGLYEDFMEMLNQLKAQDQETATTNFSTALMKRSKEEGPELMPFDRYIRRNEESVKLATKLEVQAGDIVYSGATVDVSPHTLRIVVQKAFQLMPTMAVNINFTELYSEYKKAFLQQVPYQILHISHTHNLTQITVERTDDAVPEFGDWLGRWFEQVKQDNQRNVNLNDKIYNQLLEQFIKLYCGYLNRSVFFLKQNSLHSTFLTPLALKQLSFVNNAGENKTLWLNDFARFVKPDARYSMSLLYTWLEDDLYTFSNQDADKHPIESILAWLQSKPQWRVFLVSSRKIQFPEQAEIEAIQQQADPKINRFAKALNQRYADLTTYCYLQDITAVFDNIDWSQTEPADCTGKAQIVAPPQDDYSDTVYACTRHEPRVLVSGPANVRNARQELPAELISFSTLGLKIALTCKVVPFSYGDVIAIDFSPWDTQAEANIGPVMYTVVNINREQQRFVIGLQRNKASSSREIEVWMTQRFRQLENNTQPCLAHYEQNYYFALFASLVTQNINGLPFFLGRDEHDVRIIQAVGVTAMNNNIRELFRNNRAEFEWDALQLLAADLSKALNEIKPHLPEKNAQLAVGIYCYLDSDNHWQARTDLHFATPQDKQSFIMKALSSQRYHFYHCALTALKMQSDQQIRSLVETVAAKSLKKAKEVSMLFNSLVAVGELTSTTKLLAHVYLKLTPKR